MNKHIILLDENKKPIAYMSNELPKSLPFIDDLLTRDIDKNINELKLTIPADHVKSTLVKEKGHFLYPLNNNEYGLYRIINIDEESSDKHLIQVECESAMQNDLLSDLCVPTEFKQVFINEILEYILNDTNFIVGNYDDFGLIDFNIDKYITKSQALNDLCNQLEAEFNFSCGLQGNVILEEKVNVVKQLGDIVGKLFIKGRDLNSIQKRVDTEKLVTAMVGSGKRDANGKPITFSEMNLNLPSGYIQNGDMIYSIEALEKYGSNGKHIKGVNEDNEAQTGQELADNTLKLLLQYEKPLYTYNAKVVYLKEMLNNRNIVFNLGDTIYIQDKTASEPIYLQARIRKMSTSLCNPEKDEITFGDYVAIKPRTVDAIKQLQDTIRNYENSWNAGKWTGEITSTNGNIFPEAQGETTLRFVIYRNNEEYDPAGTLLTYTWTRYDKNGDQIGFPNDNDTMTGKEIVVNAMDYDIKATYKCNVEIEEVIK